MTFNTKTLKLVFVSLLMMVMVLGVYVGYPYAKEVFTEYRVEYYQYKPRVPVNSQVDTSNMLAAKAVPVLMYHGVTAQRDEENTHLWVFVEQMEALKKAGFETVSLDEVDAFMQGKFDLPPRPVVITFDDGRKDSYYPVDDVLKSLGFEAVMFAVSGKSNDQDKFYLTWDEYRQMKATGRWDIQAHGTYSHEKVLIDEKGNYGRYLSSRIFTTEAGLESEAEFKNRVEQDYEINIADIEKQLGHKPVYYAIPLNDYGYFTLTNYSQSLEFNQQLISKHFRLAFVQANDSSNVYRFRKGIYNYADANRYEMARIEVKNMDPEKLVAKLLQEYPREPELLVSGDSIVESVLDSLGNVEKISSGMRLQSTTEFPSARAIFGDYHWSDYFVEMTVENESAQSVGVAGYIKDNQNYVALSVADTGIYLSESVDGKIIEKIRSEFAVPKGTNRVRMSFSEGRVDVFFNGKKVFSDVKIMARRGAVAFRVWSPNGKGVGRMQSVEIGQIGQDVE